MGNQIKSIKKLFEQEIQNYKTNKYVKLHIIVFDEIYVIFKAKEGKISGEANVNDLMLNLILSFIDSVEEYNNVLSN